MAFYIWCSFYFLCFLILIRILHLGFSRYPRTIYFDRWEEVIGILINIGFAIWALVLLL